MYIRGSAGYSTPLRIPITSLRPKHDISELQLKVGVKHSAQLCRYSGCIYTVHLSPALSRSRQRFCVSNTVMRSKYTMEKRSFSTQDSHIYIVFTHTIHDIILHSDIHTHAHIFTHTNHNRWIIISFWIIQSGFEHRQ